MVRCGGIAKIFGMRVALKANMQRWGAAASAAVFLFCMMVGSAIADRTATGGLLVTLNVAGRPIDARVEDAKTIKYVLRYVAGHAVSQPIAVTLSNGQRVRLDARIIRAQDCRTGQCVTLKGLYAGRSPY